MKTALVVSFVALVTVLLACTPVENAERTAACKESGNAKMCGICCKTKSGVFTPSAMGGTCACFGDLEK